MVERGHEGPSGLGKEIIHLDLEGGGDGFAGVLRKGAEFEIVRDEINRAFVGDAPIVTGGGKKIPTVDIFEMEIAG